MHTCSNGLFLLFQVCHSWTIGLRSGSQGGVRWVEVDNFELANLTRESIKWNSDRDKGLVP